MRVPTLFLEIDTRSPKLLAGLGLWHLGGIWYRPFERYVFGVVLWGFPEQTRPFMWTSNVPIETVEEPPYIEG